MNILSRKYEFGSTLFWLALAVLVAYIAGFRTGWRDRGIQERRQEINDIWQEAQAYTRQG